MLGSDRQQSAGTPAAIDRAISSCASNGSPPLLDSCVTKAGFPQRVRNLAQHANAVARVTDRSGQNIAHSEYAGSDFEGTASVFEMGCREAGGNTNVGNASSA